LGIAEYDDFSEIFKSLLLGSKTASNRGNWVCVILVLYTRRSADGKFLPVGGATGVQYEIATVYLTAIFSNVTP